MMADNDYCGQDSRLQHSWVAVCKMQAVSMVNVVVVLSMVNVVVVLSVPWITGLAVHRTVCPNLCLN